ncbi:mobilisation protein (MobC) [Nitrosospira multiformis ATCC 25196]|uniref:Mobilisation protein (MobC) n=1 Tax=Nitrosospira multiformis (strain ATCC 25196 / NCIMB 11849 / C 71) TaxID=323848 RepID=Q2Y5A4_NITMU|nr:plasmid mobilization relaxosome protein MobC [Nitrosospira multiformis]ABB76067.1 mobilization protein [Nitrosospira multiformis ATCC 25196]SEG15257.1 mobilisation protein (MobC) [Nitrosospira multiformis ATCC 25196]
MPRPKKEQAQKRPHRISIRLSDDELLHIRERANQAGGSTSKYLRKAALSGKVVIQQKTGNGPIVRQLLGIGNNLNQLTRMAHIHGGHDREKLREVLNDVQTVVMRFIDDSQD